MRSSLALALALVCSCALADVVIKNGGAAIGPVTSLDCALDGGLNCSRTTGTSTGTLRCAVAAPGAPGCVTSGAQAFGGTKTFSAVMVQGGSWLDGGTFINAALIVDGGITAKATVTAPGFTATTGFYFFNTRADGGVVYLEGDDPSGKLGIGSQGAYFNDGFSIPHSAQLCGYFPGVALSSAWSVAGNRLTGAGQFLRLSSALQVTGSGDGGVAFDGGATQSLVVSVYDVTTAKTLCFLTQACNASVNFASSGTCAADAGALFASADDIDLRVYSVECLKPPTANVCAEYQGPP